MKTHAAMLTALIAGVIAIGSAAARADDDGGGKVVISTSLATGRDRSLFTGHTCGKNSILVGSDRDRSHDQPVHDRRFY